MATINQCDICNKSFSNKYIVASHRKIHESRERLFDCECGKKFLTKIHLEKHRLLVHNDCRKFTCLTCCKSFKSQNNLETHEATHTEKSFLCRFCDKMFMRRQEVNIHEKTHKNLKEFKCSTCDKCFSQQSNLLSHIKSVSFAYFPFLQACP